MGVQSRLWHAPGRAQDRFGTAKSRSWTDLGPSRTRQERPETVQKRPRTSPEPLPDRPEATFERVRSIERRRTRLWNDFSLFLSCRAKAPMCLAYQFLQCFVVFERSKQRTRTRSEKPRKSRRFGLQNRRRDRPGDRKSRPDGPARPPKRESRALLSDFFPFRSSGEPVDARKSLSKAAKSARDREARECWYGNLEEDVCMYVCTRWRLHHRTKNGSMGK